MSTNSKNTNAKNVTEIDGLMSTALLVLATLIVTGAVACSHIAPKSDFNESRQAVSISRLDVVQAEKTVSGKISTRFSLTLRDGDREIPLVLNALAGQFGQEATQVDHINYNIQAKCEETPLQYCSGIVAMVTVSSIKGGSLRDWYVKSFLFRKSASHPAATGAPSAYELLGTDPREFSTVAEAEFALRQRFGQARR